MIFLDIDFDEIFDTLNIYKNMVTLSFSPKLIQSNEELVVLPRREYDFLVHAIKVKKLPAWLKTSLRDIEIGQVSGPFSSVKALMTHLG